MRTMIAAIVLGLSLTACAVKPDDSRFFHRGVYTPGTVTIEEDGSFHARSAVWSLKDASVAREAAWLRLIESARQRGYAFYIMQREAMARFFGQQFSMAGTLFTQEDAPSDAVPFVLPAPPRVELATVDPQPLEAAPPTPPKKKRKIVKRKKPPVEPIGEPEVIEAPEFITKAPATDDVLTGSIQTVCEPIPGEVHESCD